MPEPIPKAYAPYVAARYPAAGSPEEKPQWRVLVHRQHVNDWNRILEVCGESNAVELWTHLTTRPDQKPLLGSVTIMRGNQHSKKADGMSRVHHYRISGAGRVDYRFNPEYQVKGTPPGDKHRVVQIISIDLGSH